MIYIIAEQVVQKITSEEKKSMELIIGIIGVAIGLPILIVIIGTIIYGPRELKAKKEYEETCRRMDEKYGK